jgi:hypothetical protein
MANNAYYRDAQAVCIADPDRSADRVFLRPEAARHCPIDDDHAWRTQLSE